MPTTLVESDAFTANIQVPNAGEAADQTAWSMSAQPLTNRTFHMRKGIPGIASSYRMRCPAGNLPAFHNAGPRFELATGLQNYSGSWLNSSVTDAGELRLALPALPPFGKLLALSVGVTGRCASASSPHAAVPATKPTIKILKAQIGNPGYLTQIVGTVTDPSTTVAAYDARHVISISSILLDLATSDHDLLVLSITGETGANALPGAFAVGYVDLSLIP